MNSLRIMLLPILFSPPLRAAAQNAEAAFAVTKTGDTIKLRESAWIAVDRHPQLLVYKDAARKKHKEPASNFLVVRVPSAASAFARKDGLDFVARPIPARNGPDCWHFVQELYWQDSVRIYRSVHCRRCQVLRLYVQQDDGPVELIGDHNYLRILQAIAPLSPALEEELHRGRYNVVRVEKALWNAGR